ncbi:hypothetical protein K431DRAFT_286406 [Polychaeton citri CBS 116435]|uniref:Carbohydrate esterase family 16 protein n=1 Tax=Polychaeton citri CBS 116435 TaxID=1314669 RepID=A0A9P4Q7H2_9PEZI|nr:hypothetical protein K431DRAFT_286406 [Polychaeton citri CBS 116435]
MVAFTTFVALFAAAGMHGVYAIPLAHKHQPRHEHDLALTKRVDYSFNQLVVFGDELSDNGNGSYAHGITDNPANVYGFGTWTNGPVAVSYLANLLGVRHRNLAWGGCCGGGSYGATIDNDYTQAAAEWKGAPVPSVHDQIYNNYSNSNPNVHNALQLIWVGENDLSKHTDAFWEGDPQNSDFATQIADKLLADAEYLIGDQGAPYVMVANIYPKHKAPVTTTYLCPDGSCVETWGKVIQSANAAIEKALASSSYANQIIYYDVFGFMTDLMENKDAAGLTQPLTYYCDGDGSDENCHWDECISGSHVWDGAESFFWMNYIQPTTHVHRLIAHDMKKTIDTFLTSYKSMATFD